MGSELQGFRDNIDRIDEQILILLAARFAVTRRVGKFKREHQVAPTDPGREADQMARIADLAEGLGVNPELAQTILRFIIDEVVQEHAAMQEV